MTNEEHHVRRNRVRFRRPGLAVVLFLAAVPVGAGAQSCGVVTGWQQQLLNIVDLAGQHGFVVDPEEAGPWFEAMQNGNSHALSYDEERRITAVGLTLLDLPEDEETLRFARFVAEAIRPGTPPPPVLVRTVLALSGSTAQGRVQGFPADLDLFSRMVISAPTRAAARATLAGLVRRLAQRTTPIDGFSYRLVEVYFGTDATGASLRWSAAEIAAGEKRVGGETFSWNDPDLKHLFIKVDWVLVRNSDGLLLCVSLVIDPIWHTSNDSFRSIDSGIDAFFQEAYLDSAPQQRRLLQDLYDSVSAGIYDQYRAAMIHEVDKYVNKRPDYGKAAKRIYNLARARCQLAEAAYVGELFDEPMLALYQINGRLWGVEEAQRTDLGRQVSMRMLELLVADIGTVPDLTPRDRFDLVRCLVAAHDSLERGDDEWRRHVDRAHEISVRLLNTWFEPKLRALPQLLDGIEAHH